MNIREKILIVEDEKSIAHFISTILNSNDYETLLARSGSEAKTMISSHCPDLVILDLGLPDMDGIDVLRELRSWSSLPVVVVSARSHEHDKVQALDLGADDYLTKPFLTQELLLRIQRILQRCYRGELQRTAAKTLQLGQRTVYLADALVRLPDGTAQPLTATERALLQKLAENRGHIVTYDAVCEAVWGADYYGYENSLNVHIRHLREKLEPNPSKPQYLLTVRGIGYKLAEENAQ